MRVLIPVLLVIVSLMAGCTGNDEEPGTGGTSETPPPTGGNPIVSPPPEPKEPVTEYSLMSNFAFDGCSGVTTRVNAAAETVQSLLPEGYTAIPDDTVALPVPGTEQVAVAAHLFNCTSFTAGSFAFENVIFGMVTVPVEAPADAKEANSHSYVLEMLGGEDVLSAVWVAAGYPTFNGTVEEAETEASRSFTAGPTSLQVSKGAPMTLGASGSFAWYYEMENGDRLSWIGEQTVTATDGGAASVTASSESGLGSLSQVPAPSNVGTGAIVDDASYADMFLLREIAAYRTAA